MDSSIVDLGSILSRATRRLSPALKSGAKTSLLPALKYAFFGKSDEKDLRASISRARERAADKNTILKDVKLAAEREIRYKLLEELNKYSSGVRGMMLSTDAKEPDLEHSLLEGVVMPFRTLIGHLQRYGCRHDFQITGGNKENTQKIMDILGGL